MSLSCCGVVPFLSCSFGCVETNVSCLNLHHLPYCDTSPEALQHTCLLWETILEIRANCVRRWLVVQPLFVFAVGQRHSETSRSGYNAFLRGINIVVVCVLMCLTGTRDRGFTQYVDWWTLVAKCLFVCASKHLQEPCCVSVIQSVGGYITNTYQDQRNPRPPPLHQRFMLIRRVVFA